MKGYLLENIKRDERDSVKASCRAMFQKWLNKGRGTGEAERTWRTVLKEVESLYDAELRQEVEKELLKEVCVFLVCLCVQAHACVCVYLALPSDSSGGEH